LKENIVTAVVYVSAGAAVALRLLVFHQTPDALVPAVFFIAPVLFALASFAIFRWNRTGILLGLVACGFAVPDLWRWEFRDFHFINSWNMLNLPDTTPEIGKWMLYAKLSIAAGALVTLALVLSLLRACPHQWTVHELPVRERTWPAVVLSIVVVASWFSFAAIPYRVPMFHWQQRTGDLYMFHVERHGIHFHDTEVSFMHDCQFGVVQRDRSLFRYRMHDAWFRGVVGTERCDLIRAGLASPDFLTLAGSRAHPSRTWARDRWYIYSPETGWITVGQDQTKMLRNFIEWFHETQKLPTAWQYSDEKDVCLGFCYSPTT
jgi:hypothetical protein